MEIKMEYPVILRRKRSGSIVMSSILAIFSAVMLVYGILNSQSVLLYSVATVVFLFSLGFNIYLSIDKTLIIEKDKIYTSSVFLPKLYIEVENLRGVEYAGENGSELVIHYDLPEYNVRNILGDVEISSSASEGLWTYTLYKKDVDKPLSEVKFIIQDLIITRDSKLT